MDKYNYIVSEQVPESGKLGYREIPFVIFQGSKEDAADNLIHLVAKYLANFDFARIAELEIQVAAKRDIIMGIISSWGFGNSLSVDGRTICIRDIAIIDDPLDNAALSGEVYTRYVIYDEISHKFIDESNLADDCLPDEFFSVELLTAETERRF